jgi:hypothetical protein
MLLLLTNLLTAKNSVADPHNLVANLDPAFYLDLYPALYLDMDPDPALQMMRIYEDLVDTQC